jgi:hypothetical protein
MAVSRRPRYNGASFGREPVPDLARPRRSSLALHHAVPSLVPSRVVLRAPVSSLEMTMQSRPRRHRLLATTLFLAGATALAASPALAQNQPPRRPPPGQPEPRPDRTVYVPIEDFDKIFDREQGGVFVPYQELLRLLERANATPKPPVVTPTTPPADYVLVGAQLKGVAGERVVQFEATFDIEVLDAERWVIVPIGLAEASLEDVRTVQGPNQANRAVVGPMAALVAQLAQRNPAPRGEALPTTGYGVILKGAGRVQTTARFAVPIASKPGESSFGLSLPSAALASFEVTLPQSGLRVRVDNSLATEEQSDERADQTRVRAYFGAAQRAGVTWNPRPKQVEGEERDPLLFAETETSVRLDEGVMQATARIGYRILQAPCGEFRVQFPKGYTLLNVRGENMSAIPVPEQTGELQTITVRLHEKVKDAYALELRLEKILSEGTRELELPRIVTVGTERESGVVGVRGSEFLTLEPAALQGVSQVDASAIPPTIVQDLGAQARDARPPLAFRYLRQPYGLQVKVGRVEPEVEGRLFSLTMVKDDEVALMTMVNYTVRKRGIFGVRLRLPQGFVLTPDFDDSVKDHRVVPATDEERAQGLGDVLAIDFVNQRQPGQFPLTVVGTIRRSSATVAADGDKLGLPRVRLLDVVKETGLLAVGSQTHLQLTLEGGTPGLRPVGAPELERLSFPFKANQGEEVTFGYAYLRPEVASPSFGLKKREPKVTARAEMLVDAQEEQVKVETVVHYTVEYAGVEQVRIAVPADLNTEEKLKIEGEGIVQDRRCEVMDLPHFGSMAVWTIALQGKRTGTFPVRLRYELKLDDFKAGQQKLVTLNEVKVLDCFTETGDIALVKHENLVIADKERDGIERRDQRELPEALRARGAIQAFRYVTHDRPYRLSLEITKYDFQAPLGILVKHLHQDEVFDVDGRLKAEAWILLQNNAEQFLTVMLPPGAEVRDLLVHGKRQEWSVAPTAAVPTIQVQLGEATKLHRDQPFSIRIRYDVAAGSLGGLGGVELHTLRFPLGGGAPAGDAAGAEARDVPVARLTRSLYLPTERAYLEFDTDARKHFDDMSMWEDLKASVGVRVDRVRGGQGLGEALQAISNLRAASPDDQSQRYVPLELPTDYEARVFEKLDNPSRLRVQYVSWPVFFLLDVLALVAVVALGAFLEARRLVSGLVYVAAAAGLTVLGATFLGKAMEPFFASGLVGAVGLGGMFLVRGAWRELTVERHARRMAELAQEAQVAKARAQAAEAEARVRPGPAGPVIQATPRDPKAPGGDGAADAAAADGIHLEQGPGQA